MASVAEPYLTTVFESYFPVYSEVVVNEVENPDFVSKPDGNVVAVGMDADTEQWVGVSRLQVPNLELFNHLAPHLLVVPDSDGGVLS
jgi:hypothetical protein